MKYIIITLLSSLCFACQGQNTNQLNATQYDVLSAFINQNFDYNDHFYLNKFFLQRKYPVNFNVNYNDLIDFYKKADSICNFSKDTLQLEFFCPAAYNRNKFLNLFDNDKLSYLKETYKTDATNKALIDINKISRPFPVILEHSEEYYKKLATLAPENSKVETSNSDEFPSIQIIGIYFLKDDKIAMIEYLMETENSNKRVNYGVLKKEKGIWWRFIGNIPKK